MRSRNIIIAAFVIYCGVHTYWELKNCHDLPWPPHFIAAGIVFGMLGLLSGASEELAGVSAIGLVVASLVKKGFVGTCDHGDCQQGSPQPASLQALTTASNQVIAV